MLNPIARTAALVGLLLCGGTVASADEHPTYQSLLDAVTHADCTPKDLVTLVLYTCDKTQDLWYFTKEGHPAHPGVVRRYVVEDGGVVSVALRGWSFASDADQPAFKTFLAQLNALDAQMKEYIAAQHGVAPPALPPVHVYGNWQAQEGDNQAILFLTRYYFALEDSGRYEDAYALLDGPFAAMIPLSKYKELASQAASNAGPVKGRVIKTIDWEKDKPGGPPGLYAALDYSGETERGQICGYVAWRQEPDGFYLLVREETNIIPATLSAAEADALKAKFHCVS
ncbi:MAG TPA: DUF4019 domain-containing protein [Rhizomicrobium sp.]|nr:DUF4019 domain-containing protein [Rhizomicrobium sp.]